MYVNDQAAECWGQVGLCWRAALRHRCILCEKGVFRRTVTQFQNQLSVPGPSVDVGSIYVCEQGLPWKHLTGFLVSLLTRPCAT